jgi:hypothetical protein
MGRLAVLQVAALLAAGALLVPAACGTSASSTQPGASDARAPDSPADVAQEEAAQTFPTCTSPLADAGLTSLSDVPVVGCNTLGGFFEYTPACQGLIMASESDGVDCFTEYFFDAATGALVGTAKGCNTTIGSCTGNAGFKLPVQCLGEDFPGWTPKYLCTDAGASD